jgi:hypothetical protein
LQGSFLTIEQSCTSKLLSGRSFLKKHYNGCSQGEYRKNKQTIQAFESLALSEPEVRSSRLVVDFLYFLDFPCIEDFWFGLTSKFKDIFLSRFKIIEKSLGLNVMEVICLTWLGECKGRFQEIKRMQSRIKDAITNKDK